MRDLYLKGISFQEFLQEGDREDREKTLNYLESTNIDSELINLIKDVKDEVKILVLGEIWCPDCMINIPALEVISKYNENINFKILPREGNEPRFKKYELEGKVKIPTIIVMDRDYRELGYILERPKIFKEIYREENQVEIIKASKLYREGKFIPDMIEEVINIIF